MLRGRIDDPRRTDAALARVPDDVAAGAAAKDAQTGAEMVRAIRARAPVDRGALINGITEHVEGRSVIVEASALRDGFDYARAVEFGRHATPATFAENGDGGAPPHPFFLDTAFEVLEGREPAMDGVIDDAGRREGFR